MSVGKVVNPLGTVTTITETPDENNDEANEFSEAYNSGAYIHENCDEAMFRPYVAVISGTIDGGKDRLTDAEQQRPTAIGQKLIVPVIDGTESIRQSEKARREEFDRRQVTDDTVAQFEQMSLLNKKQSKSKVEKMNDGRDVKDVDKVSGGNAKEIIKNREAIKNVDVEAVITDESRSQDKVPTVAPRKGIKDTQPLPVEAVVAVPEDISDVFTVKIKKPSKLSAKFSDDSLPIPVESKVVAPVVVTESKPSALVMVDEPLKLTKSNLKNKKNKSVPEPSVSEDITLITDDILRDEDVQPIIESAKITLSDIMRGEAKRHEVKEQSPVPAEPTKKQKKRKSSIEDKVSEIVAVPEPPPIEIAVADAIVDLVEVVQDDIIKAQPYDESADNSKSTDDSTKSKKASRKLQRKLEKLAAEAARNGNSPESASPPAFKAPETTEFTFTLKKNILTPEVEVDDAAATAVEAPLAHDDNDDIAVLESFDKTLTGDFTQIQDSLMNPVVSATISIRKQSLKDRADSEEKPVVALTKKEKKKNAKNAQKESESDANVNMNSNNHNNNRDSNSSDPECSYAEPIETLEPDSLSFKSTTDDPISLINLESPMMESMNTNVSSVRTNASDETESNADAQFSDCKSFDMVVTNDDEPYIELKQSDTVSSFDLVMDDAYTPLKQSDTNSSDETEDSSQGKTIKSKIHEDDEELQPLISSTTNLQSDNALEISKQIIDNDDTISSNITTTNITLPEETNQSDSTKHQQSNKKKSRKKRR